MSQQLLQARSTYTGVTPTIVSEQQQVLPVSVPQHHEASASTTGVPAGTMRPTSAAVGSSTLHNLCGSDLYIPTLDAEQVLVNILVPGILTGLSNRFTRRGNVRYSNISIIRDTHRLIKVWNLRCDVQVTIPEEGDKQTVTRSTNVWLASLPRLSDDGTLEIGRRKYYVVMRQKLVANTPICTLDKKDKSRLVCKIRSENMETLESSSLKLYRRARGTRCIVVEGLMYNSSKPVDVMGYIRYKMQQVADWEAVVMQIVGLLGASHNVRESVKLLLDVVEDVSYSHSYIMPSTMSLDSEHYYMNVLDKSFSSECVMLCYMLVKYIRVELKECELDDRDDYSNKAAECYSVILGKLFRMLIIEAGVNIISSAKSGEPRFFQQFMDAFQYNRWQVIGDYDSDMQLSRVTDYSTPNCIEACLHELVILSGSHSARSSADESYDMRMLHPSQRGYVCMIRTSDDVSAGKKLHLASDCRISSKMFLHGSSQSDNLSMRKELSNMHRKHKVSDCIWTHNGKLIGLGCSAAIGNYLDGIKSLYHELSWSLADNLLESRYHYGRFMCISKMSCTLSTPTVSASTICMSGPTSVQVSRSVSTELASTELASTELASTELVSVQASVTRISGSATTASESTLTGSATTLSLVSVDDRGQPQGIPLQELAVSARPGVFNGGSISDTGTPRSLQQDYMCEQECLCFPAANVGKQNVVNTLIDTKEMNRVVHRLVSRASEFNKLCYEIPHIDKMPVARAMLASKIIQKCVPGEPPADTLIDNSHMCYSQRPAVTTSKSSGCCYGHNAVVCYTTLSGMGIEDGIVLNKASVERGMFMIIRRSSIVWSRPNKVTVFEYSIHTKINSLVKEGSVLATILCHNNKSQQMVQTIKHDKPYNARVVDIQLVFDTSSGASSVIAPHYLSECSIVLMRCKRIRTGDKLSSRHSQKAVAVRVMQQEDMPMLDVDEQDISDVDSGATEAYARQHHMRSTNMSGMLYPDVIVDPLSIISRCTMSQDVSSCLGMLAADIGVQVIDVPFEGVEIVYGGQRESVGPGVYSRGRRCTVTDGRTGIPREGRAVVGIEYYMVLNHIADEKVKSSSSHKRDSITGTTTASSSDTHVRYNWQELIAMMHAKAYDLARDIYNNTGGVGTYPYCTRCNADTESDEQGRCTSCGSFIDTKINLAKPIVAARTFMRVLGVDVSISSKD